MPHFVKRLKTIYGYYNFYFNRIFTATGVRYHVSVRDTKSNRSYMFNMEEKQDSWTISDISGCPEWITSLEKEYEKAIHDHLAS